MNRKLWIAGFVVLQCGFASEFASGRLPAAAHKAVPTGTALAQTGLPDLVFNSSRTPSSFERQGRPSRRTSGGSRGDCEDQLIALLPGNDKIVTAETTPTADCGLASIAEQTATLEAFPILWFYIPAQEPNVAAELALLDENAHVISIQTIELPAESGIVSAQISQPLAIGQTYRWVFSTLHDPHAPSQNPTVEGILQRVSPDSTLTAALNAANSPQERAQALAQQGIWHDALDVIAQLRSAEPDNTIARQSWISLLSSVGLGAITEKNVLNRDGI